MKARQRQVGEAGVCWCVLVCVCRHSRTVALPGKIREAKENKVPEFRF